MEALVRTVLAPITVTVLRDMLAQIALSGVSSMIISWQRLAGSYNTFALMKMLV